MLNALFHMEPLNAYGGSSTVETQRLQPTGPWLASAVAFRSWQGYSFQWTTTKATCYSLLLRASCPSPTSCRPMGVLAPHYVSHVGLMSYLLLALLHALALLFLIRLRSLWLLPIMKWARAEILRESRSGVPASRGFPGDTFRYEPDVTSVYA